MHGLRVLCLLVLCVSFSVALWERTDPLIVEDGTVIETSADGNSLVFKQPSGHVLTYAKSEIAAHGQSHASHTDKRLSSTATGWVSSFWSWGNSYTYFSGTWTVPSAPPTTAQNIIFFFNSLEGKTATGSGSDILQPVLQYNNAVAGWTLASWYGFNNAYTEGTPYPVTPGQTITGTVFLSNGYWYVWGYVNGVLRTTLQIAQSAFNGGDVQNTAQWALEVYNVPTCSYYPPNNYLTLSNIVLQDGGVTVTPSWSTPATNANGCNAGGYVSGSNVVITWNYAAPSSIVSQYGGYYSYIPGPHLVSPSGRYWLIMQGDGNLVVYDQSNNGHPVWWSGAKGSNTYELVMQSDGNLVIYNPQTYVWNSVTGGHGTAPFTLTMQDDSNLVIYDAYGHATWSSITGVISPTPQ